MPSGDGTQWYNRVRSCSDSGFCGPLSSDYIISEYVNNLGWNYSFTHYHSGTSTFFQFANWMVYNGVPIGLKLHIKNGPNVGSPTVASTVCLGSGFLSDPVPYGTSNFTSHKLGTRGHTIGTYNHCGTDDSGDATFNRWGWVSPYTN